MNEDFCNERQTDITRYGFKDTISDVGRASMINQRFYIKESSI